MERELELRILRELKRQCDTGRNIDVGVQYKMSTSSYVCPDIAAKEWDVFFQDHGQVVGLSCDLPEPGSFVTIEDFGHPVLATRDKDGDFRAFVNSCRHRGAQVVEEPRGTKKAFTCPFHFWTYDTGGALKVVSDERDFGPIDKSCNGLIELPAEECGGLLFVHPQPDGKLNAAELLGEELLAELSTHDLSDSGFGASKTITMDLNWKLALDTFGETYHFARLHKDTLAHVFPGNNLHYEEFGRHHRFTTASHGISAFDGKPESEWDFWTGTAFMLYYIFPNIIYIFNNGAVNLIRFYPDPQNPGRSTTQIAIYTAKEAIAAELAAQVDTNADTVYSEGGNVNTIAGNLEVFTSTVEFEDYRMGEAQQKSAASGALKEVIFGHNEPPLHHFHKSFREALGMSPLEKV